jgi:hypothetical protein
MGVVKFEVYFGEQDLKEKNKPPMETEKFSHEFAQIFTD